MSAYNPFGNPIAPGQGTPKFPQDAKIPAGDFRLLGAEEAAKGAPAEKSEPAQGMLVQSGAGIVPQVPRAPNPTLQVAFDKLTPADFERFETARRAMFPE